MLILNQLGSVQSFFGSCCYLLCFNDAIYYDNDGKGYCLPHAPKNLIDDDD